MSRCKKQVHTTFTSSQKTRHQKLNSYLVMNSLGDSPVHTAAPFAQVIKIDSIIALRFQPIRSRSSRWLYLNNHLLKMNNHLPLQFTPHISVCGWFAVL